MRHQLFHFLLLIFLISGCKNEQEKSDNGRANKGSSTPIINYAVTNTFPHDTSLFTEGLLVYNGQLFESTGSPSDLPNAKSIIGIVDLKTGNTDKKVELDKLKFFGEGIAILNDKIYQLTYKNQFGFIYDANTFKQVGTFNFSSKEGWGLTTNGKALIMSDGTEKLTFLSPETFKPLRTLSVTEGGVPLKNLNELEYIKGLIYANVWTTNFIVKIHPWSGKVVGKLDLSSLVNDAKNKNPHVDVLNGIAYDSTSNKTYITGKFWSNIYQIDFSH